MIGIIGAMDIEVESLKRLLQDVRKEKISNIEYFSGKIGETETVIAKCGIGKVFAAICAQTMIMRFKPDVIVNIGVAGGLSQTLHIGDIVIADSVAQHDMDTTALGDERGLLSEIGLVKIPADTGVLNSLEDACRYSGINYEIGTIASGDEFVSSANKKQFIKDAFSAKACEMEGAAIGQVCFVNKVPFGVLRAISDGANDGANMDFPEFAAMAAENSAKVIERFVYTLKR
ncbi:MAG: 5'-methylthioadenosine/adenosylhomocysteine nucleosidase [Firmicutes bacterium]|nr:5'-methylthioadenosine/adenosylhomocysteine nucleosidase [Bacillota bacterium]